MNKNTPLEQLMKWIDEFDINAIPLEKRKEWYRSYTRAYLASLDADYEDPTKYLEKSSREEQCEDVEPVKSVIERLFSFYNMDLMQFVITRQNGVETAKEYDVPVFSIVPFGAMIPNLEINLEIIDQEMKSDGYHRWQTAIRKDDSNMEWCILGYHPIKQPDIQEAIRYFHLLYFSPSIFREQIRNNGLVPDDGNGQLTYPEARVYLYVFGLRSGITDDFKKAMHQTTRMIKEEHPEWDETYDVFEIDKSRTKNLELHYDYNMSSCVYTKKSISNNALILKKTGIVF